MGASSLADAKDLLFKAFQFSFDAIAVSRLDDGRLVDVNAAFLRLLGFDRDEVIGRTTLELDMWVDEADRNGLVQLLRDDGATGSHEVRLRTRSGEIRDIELSAHVVDVDGVPCILAIDRDVTERHRADEALRTAFDREHEVSRQLRTLDEMKNTLLEAVSHDLRSPLTTILGIALTLQRDDLQLSPQETHDLLRRLATSAQKLERLLADLLDMDRFRRGLVVADRRPTDLGQLVARVVRECDLPVNRQVHVDARAVVSDVDEAKVERIVESLVTNTIRHTPAGTPLWVRVEPTDDGVLIVVEDAGGGVREDMRGAIFEPFRQAATNPKDAPGVGIGLALVARFAELHGGRAWVEDRPGGGASFRVLLPSAAPRAA